MLKPSMNKVPEFPRVHVKDLAFSIPVESATEKKTTIIPIMTYDEGLGVISAWETNPANASFVEYVGAQCYPTSRINKIWCKMTVSMGKIMLETDKVHAIKFGTMKIFTSFMDGQLAEDEVSGLDNNEILMLQNEQTDRQTFPLYNTVKLPTYKSTGLNTMATDQAGLT